MFAQLVGRQRFWFVVALLPGGDRVSSVSGTEECRLNERIE